MQMRTNPLDSDVPFFPFNIRPSGDGSHFVTTNHLTAKPIHLNKQAAEILRLTDGETPLSIIIARLVDRYPDAGGPTVIHSQIIDLLRFLTAKELIWWREKPLELLPAEPPSSVFWELTAACNLRCLHCVVSAGLKADKELPTKRCLELIEELADFGLQSIAFSGGEPLLHPDFRLIAEKVRNRGLMIQVATNGTMVTKEIAQWLKELNAEVQVSLDGSIAEIHDYVRPGCGAFAKAVEGIRTLVDTGHEVMIGTVLSTLNANDIPSLISLAETLDVAHFRLIPFVPKGRGESYMNLEVSLSEVKRVVQFLHELRGKTKVNIVALEFEDMLEIKLCADPFDINRHLGCHGAVSYATITPTGELLPCHFFEGVRADNVAFAPF